MFTRFRSTIPFALLWLAAAGCVGDASSTDEEPTAASASAIAVPACLGGLEQFGPGRCKNVPPVNKPPYSTAWAPFVVDGVRTPSEYFGAVKVPFVNTSLKASPGDVYVSVDEGLGKLHVFAQNLPGPLDGELRVYLDFDRFRNYSSSATWAFPVANDRAYGVNLSSGALTAYSGKVVGTSVSWQPVVPSTICLPFGGCIPLVTDVWSATIGRRTTDGAGVPRFDVEYEIALPGSFGAYGYSDGKPSLGFAIAEQPPRRGGAGAFPEEMALAGTTTSIVNGVPTTVGVPATRVRDLDRSLWQTLRFATPRGVGLTFATWNVKRFTTFMHDAERLAGSGDALDDGKIPASYVGRYAGELRADVLALEEAWDHDQVLTIRDEANAWRAAHGLAPYFLIGTIDYPTRHGIDFDATQGGVFILSAYPATRIDTHAFDACRGEDCLKRKGVLHARLNFGATSTPGPNDPPASGDQFIDVYATHLNADEELCGDGNFGDWIKVHALESLKCVDLNPLYAAACGLESILGAGEMNCGHFPNDAFVRQRQLDEMEAFIELTADPTRPSILMGDFNLNGRNLGAGDGEYSQMLDRLHVSPLGASTGGPKPSDALYPWSAPYGVPGTIEHSDLVRAQYSDDDLVAYGRGTMIRRDLPDEGPIGSTDPALARLDYVLVRQPIRPGAPGFDALAWMVGAGYGDVWASPFPSSSSIPIDSIGGRLSDHKPVLAHLELIPMQLPPKFHPDWSHDVHVRVTSANASNEDDCTFCGAVDLYPVLKRQQSTLYGPESAIWDGNICDDSGAVSSADGCTGDWVVNLHHDPAFNFVQGGGADLWDDDDTSGDDHFATVPFGVADLLQMNWSTQRLELRDYATASATPCLAQSGGGCAVWWSDKPTIDNATRGQCTRTEPPFVCLELDMTELPPTP
jgi:endonuclease/exonuclease/phosphatase family metal-dependent hydrolase